MVFSSITFIFYFLSATLLVYYLCPPVCRNGVLLIFSLLFYGWGEPVYIGIMLFSTLFDYANGLLIGRLLQRQNRAGARAVLVLSVVGNLGILGFFKYADLCIATINTLFGTAFTPLGLPLPIGISFYTFQTMSYTIDVYLQRVSPQKNIVAFGAYVTMFMQLVAGPIVQYKDVCAALQNRRVTPCRFRYGIYRFVAGLGKKVLLANNIGALWEQISTLPAGQLSCATAWLGILAFALQIYFDFSGYSDMAIGLGEMFGFTFLENFSMPYCAISIADFWRRWHISLGNWFKEYVYIPLGGSRHGKARQLLSTMVVWGLTGLWHGASYNFVLWGLYFGVLLLIEKWVLHPWLTRAPLLLRRIYTMGAVLVGWVLFAFEDMGQIAAYLSTMFGFAGSWYSTAALYYLQNFWPLWLVCCLLAFCHFSFQKGTAFFSRHTTAATACRAAGGVVIMLLCTAFLVGSSYNPFLYFRF